MHQTVRLPLGIYLLAAPQTQAIELAGAADVSEHGLHDGKPPAIQISTSLTVDPITHARSEGGKLARQALLGRAFIETTSGLKCLEVALEISGNLFKHAWKEWREISECGCWCVQTTMIDAQMLDDVASLCFAESEESISATIVEQRQMYEAAAESINRCRPSMEALGELDHLFVSDAASVPIARPARISTERHKKLLAVFGVGL